LLHVSCWKRNELLSSGVAETVKGVFLLFILLVLIKKYKFKKGRGSYFTLEEEIIFC